MMTSTPPRLLETICHVGSVDVTLPLSTELFDLLALASVAARFPDALRLTDGRLVLAPIPDAHTTLCAALRELYAACR